MSLIRRQPPTCNQREHGYAIAQQHFLPVPIRDLTGVKVGRHRAEDTPGWIRAALGAAVKPRKTPAGGFVMTDGHGNLSGPRTRATIRRGDSLAVPGLQLVRAAMHPVVPRQRLTGALADGLTSQDDTRGGIAYGDRCAVCGHPHVESAPCVPDHLDPLDPVEPVEAPSVDLTPPGGSGVLAT